VDCTVLFKGKRLKKEKKKKQRHTPRVNFFFLAYLRVLGLSVKIYSKVMGLAATLDPRILFIILIITLNLHDLSLSKSGCNTRP